MGREYLPNVLVTIVEFGVAGMTGGQGQCGRMLRIALKRRYPARGMDRASVQSQRCFPGVLPTGQGGSLDLASPEPKERLGRIRDPDKHLFQGLVPLSVDHRCGADPPTNGPVGGASRRLEGRPAEGLTDGPT
jgi:hypothetical protein